MSPSAHVLVVEDEPALVELLRVQLAAAGFRVTAVPTGEQALSAQAGTRHDLVILDIGLSGGLNGIDVCRTWRAADDWTPVVFLTARDDEVDRVLGLELGADDYVTKPYSPRVLMATVRALLRRHRVSSAGGSAALLRHGPLVVDVQRREVFRDELPVSLTATEFNLLAHLLGHPARVHPRGDLLHAVWGFPPDDDSRTVDVHVAQLRAKLGDACPVRTVRGVGYGIRRSP
ncbi:MAG: response regulator transcription factor [Dermatophilaceae bacterium]